MDKNFKSQPKPHPFATVNSVLVVNTTAQRCTEGDGVVNSSNSEINCNKNREISDSTKNSIHSEQQ